jgi:succinyl-diaminopimelate desuccinylase
MSRIDEIFKRIDGYRDEIISLQKDLTSRVALGPVNAGTGEHEKAEYLKGKLRELDPDHLEEIKAPDARAEKGYRPNVLARWEGEKGAPTVWVLSHTDIVPPGDLALWDGNPYEVRVEGDKIIGRGVEDNQHGIVSSYWPSKPFLRRVGVPGAPWLWPWWLTRKPEANTGSTMCSGTIRISSNLRTLSSFLTGATRMGTMIEVAEKSMLWMKFTSSESSATPARLKRERTVSMQRPG